MSTIWQFIATFALPAPLCLLLLLNVPVPKYVVSFLCMSYECTMLNVYEIVWFFMRLLDARGAVG